MVTLEQFGEGEVVVVLHGLPVPPESVETITEELVKSHRVVVPNYCGLGFDPEETGLRIERALLDEGVDRAILVGHSFGAYHAFQLAIRGNIDAVAIAALAPLANLPDEVEAGYEELAQALEAESIDIAEVLSDQWFEGDYLGDNPQVKSMVRRWFDELGSQAIIRAARIDCIGPDLRPRLGEISAPTYIRVGSADAATPPSWSEEIAELLGNARMEVVDGVGHFPHFEDREATVEAVRNFVANHS